MSKGGDSGSYRPDGHEKNKTKTQLLLNFCVSIVTCGRYVHMQLHVTCEQNSIKCRAATRN